MGMKEENAAARIEGGVVVVDPEPQNGVAAKAIDWLEWAIIKLMNNSTKPLPFRQGNFAPTDETPPLKHLPVKGPLPFGMHTNSGNTHGSLSVTKPRNACICLPCLSDAIPAQTDRQLLNVN